MTVARRDIDRGRLEPLPVGGLLGLPAGRARQPFGEDRGEHRRHMLGDDDRNTIERGCQRLEHLGQSLRAAGGAADRR